MSIAGGYDYWPIIESMSEGVIVQTSDGVMIACNKSAENILGLTHAQMIQECSPDPRWCVIHEDGTLFLGDVPFGMFILNRGQSSNNMIMGVRKPPDGAITWVAINISPVFGASKEPSSVIVITLTDITKRRNAENLLKEKESNFLSFFEAAQDLIVVASTQGQLLYVNEAVSKKLGYTSVELLSMGVLDLHPRNMRLEAEAIFGAMLRGERESCSLPLATKSGALVAVETRVWAGRWNGGDCIFGFSKDMTLDQEASQRFERLFRNNPVAMALSDILERRFYDVNETFLKTFGYTKEEVIGKTAGELGLFPDKQKQENVRDQFRAMGSIAEVALQVRCKNGTIVEGLFSGEIIKSQGREYFLTVMIDITERNQAQKALRASEQLYYATFQGSHAVKLIIDPADGAILDANSAAAGYYGYSIEKLKQLNIADIDTLSVLKIQQKMSDAVLGARKYFNSRHRLADGEIRDVEAYSSPIRIDNREVLYSIIHDITDRNRVQEEVRQQSGLILSLLDNIPDIIFIKTVAGVYLGCNQEFANFVGRSRSEIIGRTDYDLFDKKIADSFREYDQQMLSSCQSKSNEEWISYPDGRKVLVDTLKTPYWGPDKELVGILGISRDITERKVFENIVKENRNNLVTILDNLPFLAWLKDGDGRFLVANESFAVSCGLFKASDLLGKTDEDIWPKHLAQAYRKDDLEVMASRKRKKVEEIVHDKGVDKWFETYKSPLIDINGSVVGTAGFAYDITERKLAEEKIRKLNQDLELRVKVGMEELAHVSRVAVLGQITAAFAHELNQPLGSILNWVSSAEVALDQPVANLGVVRDSLLRIAEADKRAASVIAKIRGLVKKNANVPEKVDLDDLVGQVVKIMESDGVLKRVRIDVLSTNASKVVCCDKIQIQQVLLNLIINAIEACSCESEKKVIIRTDIDACTHAFVSISDNGPGVDTNNLDALFQPFYTTKKDGVGIGLFICRSIIQMYGGELTARNNSDKGATFMLSLPLVVQEQGDG
jgi:PAS domain S-box-containing protein